ncbi:MAG: (2Fe-2S)-binding protein [Cytophagales bacterium]|nr:(2Fe-2S)-binding protein [Cytophagales bacterium]
MPRIIIDNLASKAIESEDKSKKLLQVLLEHTDWMHACGGKGRCTTCKVVAREGLQHFESITHIEQRLVNLNKLQRNERLACQVTISSDVVVAVANENKLPHLKYSD